MHINLKQHIHFENEVIKYENILAASLPDQLKPFLNQKIVKVTNELTQKVNSAIIIPEFNPSPLPQGFASSQGAYFQIYDYSVSIRFKICFYGGKYEDRTYYCMYKDGSCYLGDLDKQVLTKIYDLKPKALIDEAKTLENINKYHALIAKADKVKDLIKLDFNLYKRGY